MRQKKEKAPTLGGILIVGLVMACAGAGLGGLFLASFPLRAIGSTDEAAAFSAEFEGAAPSPGQGYFLSGPEDRTRSWQRQLRALENATSGTEVAITHGQLNAWVAAKFRGAQPKEGTEEANLLVVPGVPNFFIDPAVGLQISMPCEVTFFGKTFECLVVATGTFPSGAATQFQIERLRLNHARLPANLGIPRRVIDFLLQAYRPTEAYRQAESAWERVETVAIKENQLVLRLR